VASSAKTAGRWSASWYEIMKVLIFGQKGQVAQELARYVPDDVVPRFLNRYDADLLDPAYCAKVIAGAQVDAVINAAAWTAVDRAETEEAAATVVNGCAPGAMANACASANLPFIHISTDYVFDGTGDVSFTPDYPPQPVSAYGRSKLAGEDAIRESGAHHLILRTSWVVSEHGANFIKTMLRLGATRDVLNVVSDQIGGPTPAASIAKALYRIVNQMRDGHSGGTYHLSGEPDTNWANFARAIMADSGLNCQIRDILTEDYPTPVTRPLNSRLDCSTLKSDFGIERPNWRRKLKNIIKDLGAKT
jgi:dTDP-4-dehydrorhamnose reductase